mmetsp:Transcript_48947/g.158116  ORF Transcript_48947/g.158116 Transcript_48947/m.158116 type:complete len:231 (+) Transcript_48947:78-770(+)
MLREEQPGPNARKACRRAGAARRKINTPSAGRVQQAHCLLGSGGEMALTPIPTAMNKRPGAAIARARGKPKPKGLRMSKARASGTKTKPAKLMLKGPQLSAAALSMPDKSRVPSKVLKTPRLCVKVKGLFTSDPAKVKRRFSSMKERMPRSSRVWSKVASRKASVTLNWFPVASGVYVVIVSSREKVLNLLVPEVKLKITNAPIASTNAGAPSAPMRTQVKKSTCSCVAK